MELMKSDLVDAKHANDPWPMLAHFRLMGFPMIPAESVH